MFLETGGIRLYYEKTGGGPPLVLLHGNGETHQIFDEAVRCLHAHFTVYAVDSRGHGQSSDAGELHYEDMARDIFLFITGLGLNKPILYGFSDGGIIGLLLAIMHPGLLSHLIVSGANTHPGGIKQGWLNFFRLVFALTRSAKFKMMLEEPCISDDMLRTIVTPTHITAGSRDMIRAAHTRSIHENIPGSILKIFEKESHASYILHSDKIAKYLIEILSEKHAI